MQRIKIEENQPEKTEDQDIEMKEIEKCPSTQSNDFDQPKPMDVDVEDIVKTNVSPSQILEELNDANDSKSPLGPIENDSITDKFDHKSELNEDGSLRRSSRFKTISPQNRRSVGHGLAKISILCDCFLTHEEYEHGELGCGEDCLNRLLMIECGHKCNVGDRCSNKRFQKMEYSKCTEKKGFGIEAAVDIPAGDFIMEYVRKVLDSEQFGKRANDYSNDKNRHYYFMALRSDAVIDATTRGNISRFINHSCDPIAETQK